MAAEPVRGKESARPSCPLHSEAVPSWDYALVFSEPNTGWKSGEALPAVVAGSLHGRLSYRAETPVRLLRLPSNFLVKQAINLRLDSRTAVDDLLNI
jgi:hypothetical protein